MAMANTFIGIDWSGANGEFHRGIQVAILEKDDSQPQLIVPSNKKGWSRQAVFDLLLDYKLSGKHVLAGIDFAFCHPFSDVGYYPGFDQSPSKPEELWALIDKVNTDYDHFYGGGVWGHADLRRYYNAPKNRDGRGGKGDLFESRRRFTETVAAAINKRSPSPTFNCVGPAGVGTGSLSGMRLLHHIKDNASVWPFNMQAKSELGSLTLVEIYPALYFTMAGINDSFKKSDPLNALNQALAHFGCLQVNNIEENVPDHDDLDAIISAAALRSLYDPENVFFIDPKDQEFAKTEGWIFGAGRGKC